MKQVKKLFTIQTLLIVMIVLLPAIVRADGTDPVPGDPDAPIDGGLSLLVAAGVGYGAKKLRDKKKQEAEK